ncbi:hypothetical protein [Brevundimonas sp. SH203]|uniref:hypothetical protein n=1 Tax=Brevundimonas sp. SH203 TaxID=345167 RepID=UPI0013562F84|nr:hypothetical protein [Brevundimonas sp. SH203]
MRPGAQAAATPADPARKSMIETLRPVSPCASSAAKAAAMTNKARSSRRWRGAIRNRPLATP